MKTEEEKEECCVSEQTQKEYLQGQDEGGKRGKRAIKRERGAERRGQR